MNNLQQSIINKKPNINLLKRDFEKFKKQIIDNLQIIIDINKNDNNKIHNIFYNKKIDENITNNISNNNNINNKFNINKLQIIHSEQYIIISSKNSLENKIIDINNLKEIISNLEVKNKELDKEIEKLKEKNKNIINEKNEINNLSNIIIKFIDLINNILKEFEIFNLNENELKEELNSFYNKNKNNNLNLEQNNLNIIINQFHNFTNDIKNTLKNTKEENEKLKKEIENKDKELTKKINDEKENNEEKNNKISKTNIIFDIEGDLSFKGESLKINNLQNTDEDNKFICTLDNNTTGSFTNINSNLQKLFSNNSKNSSYKNTLNNNSENDFNEGNDKNEKINKDSLNNDDNINEGYLDINKEILKYQNNLKNRIKSLEEEIEIQKSKNLNFFIEIKNDLYDFNEEKISYSKYTNLMKLYEKEQETNKILEKKYISSIEKINNNLLKYFKKMNCEIELEGIENNNIITSSLGNENKINISSGGNMNKSVYNKVNNLHFDYSDIFKTKSILKINENNLDDKIKNKYELKIKNLIQENNSLKKNEKLLIEQLHTIKNEIKELKCIIKEKEEKIEALNEDFQRRTLLQKDKLYIPLRNGLELLITEINLNNKIKDILKGLLNISLYNNEEIETIFKYKEKKKNIIGIFKF